MRHWGENPHVRLWTGPALRLVGIVLVLSCVAFIGSRPSEEQKYGSPIRLEESFQAAENAAPARGPHSSSAEVPEKGAAKAEGDSPPPPAIPCQKEAQQKPSGVLSDGRIILNEATLQDLTRLPGVGESRAQAILDLRARLGRFRKVSDLLRVRGIGWKTLKKMNDLLVVDRPAEEKVPQADMGQKAAGTEA